MLREEKGHREVADEQDGDDKTACVLDTHNRSTPLTINAATAKNTTVTITNTMSSTRASKHQVARAGHAPSLAPVSARIEPANKALTGIPRMLMRC